MSPITERLQVALELLNAAEGISQLGFAAGYASGILAEINDSGLLLDPGPENTSRGVPETCSFAPAERAAVRDILIEIAANTTWLDGIQIEHLVTAILSRPDLFVVRIPKARS